MNSKEIFWRQRCINKVVKSLFDEFYTIRYLFVFQKAGFIIIDFTLRFNWMKIGTHSSRLKDNLIENYV